mmetsp:Transcript_17524/g.30665  ORF Transcript_17524/g.30665 Transcript_17524/m.30665 type:complete len:307 (-) Transcript_17524:105-1025(-)
MSPAPNLDSFMEAVARKQKAEPPLRYGYKADIDMGVGFYREEHTGCHVLEKPVVICNGTPHFQGYATFYAYCSKAGVHSLLEGQMPPVMPASKKAPDAFQNLVEIANNFGNKDPEAAKGNSEFCVAFRVPIELANMAEVPGRDIWMVDFRKDKISPFLQAAHEGDAAKIKQLMSQGGIKGDVVNEDGVSALMMAAMTGSAETCQALISGGAAIDWVDPNSERTALMFAAQGGHDQVVHALLIAKADASKVDNEGQSALHWAAVAGKPNTCKLLLNGGSSKDAKNKQGMTAAQVAEKAGHTNMALLK